MLNIKPEHIETKKKIGTLKGKAVVEIKTTGGLYMVVCQKSDGLETLGTGPHRAVARHIAESREPDVEWQELSKADWVDPSHFQHLLPEYEELTNRFNE